MTSIAFSQTGTNNTTSKDTSINLPKPVAKEVVKDIVRGDSAIAELENIKRILERTQNNIALKDSIINLKNNDIEIYKQKEGLWKSIVDLESEKTAKWEAEAAILKKALKKEKRKRIFHDIIGGVIIGGLGYLLVK